MAEDAGQVRAQIAQERAELGETVKALAAKADVKGRVRHKASDSAEQVQHKAEQVAGQVQHKAEQITGQVQHTAEQVGERLRSATPDPVVSGVQTATTTVRQRPIPVATALVLVVVGVVLGWRLRRKS